MEKSAFILECKLFREYFADLPDFTLKDIQRRNRFGEVNAIELSHPRGKVLVYEEGGMNAIRTLPQSSMPVFSDIFLSGVKNVYLLGFCGSLETGYAIGDFVIPQSFLDFTKNRTRSFLEELRPGELFFYRMADPYSPSLVRSLFSVTRKLGYRSREIENYIIMEGPRFESSAEIQAFIRLGGKAICLSGIPDVYFARELDLNFVCGFFISDMAEGLPDSGLDSILETAAEQTISITKIVANLIDYAIHDQTDRHFHVKYWMQKPSPDIYHEIQ